MLGEEDIHSYEYTADKQAHFEINKVRDELIKYGPSEL